MKIANYIIILFLLGVIFNNCTSEKNCECKPKKYTDFLYPLPNLTNFFELNEAIKCAHLCNKPLLIEFICFSCNREMDHMISNSERIIELINRNYLFVKLYVDDKTVAETDCWIVNENGDTLKTIGKINYYYEISMFSKNSLPLFAIIDKEMNPLVKPMFYNPDENVFLKFLEEGIKSKK